MSITGRFRDKRAIGTMLRNIGIPENVRSTLTADGIISIAILVEYSRKMLMALRLTLKGLTRYIPMPIPQLGSHI